MGLESKTDFYCDGDVSHLLLTGDFILILGTCTLILGRHLGFLKPDSSSELATRLAEAVRIHFTASRDAFYGLPLWKLLPTSAYKQLIESEDVIYKYVQSDVARIQ